MPKELTHWLIASNVMEALEGNSNLRKLLTKYKSYYLLGAVIYDTPYSSLALTKKQKQFKKIADTLHGAKGEDAFCPFKNIFKDIYESDQDESNEPALAFSLGFLAHVIVDLNFHPMVFYLTGNYYSEDKQERNRAVSNHRWLETNIDLWFLRKTKLNKKPIKYLKEIIKDVDSSSLSNILNRFVKAIGLTNLKEVAKEYKITVNYHAFFQQLFFMGWLRDLLILLLGKAHKTVALFYPKSAKFNGVKFISYLHPVTGFNHESTVDSLKKNTERKLLTVLKEVDRILYQERSDQNLQDFIDSLPNLSIETGVARTSPKDMKFFNNYFDRSTWSRAE